MNCCGVLLIHFKWRYVCKWSCLEGLHLLSRNHFSAENGSLEQVARGGCGCPIPGGIQGQAGSGSGQPGLVVGDPAHSRGLELHEHCGPFQPRPFYDSVIL